MAYFLGGGALLQVSVNLFNVLFHIHTIDSFYLFCSMLFFQTLELLSSSNCFCDFFDVIFLNDMISLSVILCDYPLC